MIKRVILFFFCMSLILELSAQQLDSIQSISGVEITANKMSAFAAGIKIQKFDSTTLNILQSISIATLLTEQSPVFLRSSGPGGVSTLSIRGTNSSQSGVFWNGINLNQPNLGQTDLSRISTFEFNDISVQSGSASALLGSGVIGGSLHLANNMKYSTPLQSAVSFSGATSGKLNTSAKISVGNKNLAYTGSISGDWNQNKFYYKAFDGSTIRLQHALMKSISTIHQAEYRLSPKQRITAGIWYQTTDRQIPPTMTMAESDQQQWDQAIRCSVQWSNTGVNQSVKLRAAFVDEKEHFQSKTADINSIYHLNTFQTEIEYKRSFGKNLSLGGGSTGRLIRADVPYYQGIKYQPEGSFWVGLAYNQLNKGIKAAINLRQDVTKGYKIPFCPAFSAELPVTKLILSSFSVSRNFRIPSMNDRFWIPGGNPDLKPESSWNIEGGLVFNMVKQDAFESNLSINLYNLLINNLIQWVPLNSSIWSPKNVQQVWSRGIEIASKTNWKSGNFSGFFKFGYNYTPSTYKSNSVSDSNIISKQLIYTPLHKVIETFYVKKDKNYLMCSFSLTGKRFVQADNNKSLPAYSLFDIFGGTTLKMKKLNIRLQAEIYNVLNIDYQSVLYYPEPGRSFAFSLIFSQ